jgi:hypothetical protein
VLITTVTSIVMATIRGSLCGYRATMNGCAASDTTPEMIIALISDHALMRHQYQRRINTSPVPDPSASRNSHAPWTVSSCHATTADARKRNTVAQRDIET